MGVFSTLSQRPGALMCARRLDGCLRFGRRRGRCQFRSVTELFSVFKPGAKGRQNPNALLGCLTERFLGTRKVFAVLDVSLGCLNGVYLEPGN